MLGDFGPVRVAAVLEDKAFEEAGLGLDALDVLNLDVCSPLGHLSYLSHLGHMLNHLSRHLLSQPSLQIAASRMIS